MYRRAKAGDVSSPSEETSRPPSVPSHRVGHLQRHSSRDATSNHPSTPVLLGVVSAVLFVAFMVMNVISPSSVHDAEQSLYSAEQRVQDEVSGFFGGGVHERQHPPIPQSGGEERRKSDEATAAMLKQDSSWVDGEKKLKQKLKVLAERQARGLDLGVPVLTRWLGDDIPAWAGEGVDVEEWQKKVDARYAEMREEENKWRERVAEFMESGHTTK